mgnify:CR=1 FL=1
MILNTVVGKMLVTSKKSLSELQYPNEQIPSRCIIALIVGVHAIPTIQQYPDECTVGSKRGYQVQLS